MPLIAAIVTIVVCGLINLWSNRLTPRQKELKRLTKLYNEGLISEEVYTKRRYEIQMKYFLKD